MSDTIDRLDALARANMLIGAYTEAASLKKAADEIRHLRAKLEKIEKKMKEGPRLMVKSGFLTNLDDIEVELDVTYVLMEYENGNPNGS